MSVPKDLNRFEFAPTNVDISRSVFNRDHSVKFSCNVGDCVPFLCDEVLPGDTFSIDTNKVVRMQPLVAPIMDTLFIDTYYFFVPNRLIWEHWKEFQGENNESAWTPQVEYSIPKLTIPCGGFNTGTIADYMGVPTGVGDGVEISALPFRAYALICDEWFRDQNNMTPIHVTKDDTGVTGSNGSDQTIDIEKGGAPFIASKMHDYFTSCLPGAQKGTAVSIASGGLAPVLPFTDNLYDIGDSIPDGVSRKVSLMSIDSNGKFTGIPSNNTTVVAQSDGSVLSDTPDTNLRFLDGFSQSGSANNIPLVFGNLFADLSFSSAVNVNQLRQAFAVQKYFERLARGGSRYIETIKSLFGVTSPDGRLQRSEYLGGNRVPLNVSQVEQTSATEEDLTPLGSLAGMSLTGNQNSDFTKSFTEHGYIIGIAVVRYHHTYQNGLERHWFRNTVYDYYQPLFANLGEQAVYNREIFLDDSTAGTNDSVFGYQEAWADYRYKPNRVAGEMRSNATLSLDCYHLADDYASLPTLTDSWIREDKTMLDRCLAVTSSVSNQIICDFWIKNKVARPMPLYSIPGLIDHH